MLILLIKIYFRHLKSDCISQPARKGGQKAGSNDGCWWAYKETKANVNALSWPWKTNIKTHGCMLKQIVFMFQSYEIQNSSLNTVTSLHGMRARCLGPDYPWSPLDMKRDTTSGYNIDKNISNNSNEAHNHTCNHLDINIF